MGLTRMRLPLICAALTVALTACGPDSISSPSDRTMSADIVAPAAAVLGGQLFYTGGTVTITVQPATAGLVSELGLYSAPSPGSRVAFIALNQDVGTVVVLDPATLGFSRGDELIFGIFVLGPGDTFFLGPGSRNPDGIEHAVVDQQGPNVFEVGFEDLFGGGDRDFDDNVFLFEGGVQQESPLSADVRPGSCPNPLNTAEAGVLPAAILGAADFDVSEVDPTTVALMGVPALRWDVEDVATLHTGGVSDPPARTDCTTDGADGFSDLTLKFDAQSVVAALGAVIDGAVVVVRLTGSLRDGTPIAGEDVVWIRRKK